MEMDDFLEKRELMFFCICLGKVPNTTKYRVKVTREKSLYFLLPNGTKDGTYQEFWDELFQIPKKNCEYSFDRLHGPLKKWSKEGVLLLSENYKEGLEKGRFIEFYPSGEQKKIREFVDGSIHGFYRENYPNGKKRTVRWYKKGRRTGEATYWDEDGNIIGRGQTDSFGRYTGDEMVWEGEILRYHNKRLDGELHGTQICYSDRGRYKNIQDFHKGKRISSYNYKG